MNLFIDTNIFLSFYHLTSEDLEEIRKLAVLIDKGDIVLWLPQQVEEEYLRNRENKISDALKKLREQNFKGQYPAFCKDYDEYNKLKRKLEKYSKTYSKLFSKITDDISSNSLDADKAIKDLFERAKYIETTTDLINAARNRVNIGNPPGKNNSLGDAINWECLIENVPQEEDLYLITDDKDFFSLLENESPKDFLSSEWEKQKKSKVFIYKRLSQFFKEHYPHIKLASDLEKQLQVDALIKSGNFSRTHTAVEKLSKFDEFTDTQVNGMIEAYFSNNQINWIRKDDDVKSFYIMLVTQYKDVIEQENLEWITPLLGLDTDTNSDTD